MIVPCSEADATNSPLSEIDRQDRVDLCARILENVGIIEVFGVAVPVLEGIGLPSRSLRLIFSLYCKFNI